MYKNVLLSLLLFSVKYDLNLWGYYLKDKINRVFFRIFIFKFGK